MKIAVDIRPLLERNRAGVSLYTLNILESLIRNATHDYALFCNSSRLPFPADAPAAGPRISRHFFRYPNRLLNASFAYLGQPKIESLVHGADMVYMPNVNFIATEKPLIVTVHDLSFRRYPQFFSAKQRLWHRLVDVERMIRRAAAVVAVSAHTKDDIMETYGVPAGRIGVVTPAVSDEYRPQSDEAVRLVRKKYTLSERFVLYLGTLEPRKNVVGLIDAFGQANTDADLVLAGGEGWLYRQIYEAADRSPKRDRIKFIGYVEEADKPALYSAADVFAYPSFYEGFGMPVLEAMACGTSVIASHTSSLGEVVGDAGLLVNPARQDELVMALEELLKNQSLRERLAARGIDRARLFTWRRSAANLERVFEKI